MKFLILLLSLLALACSKHTFVGTNVGRMLVFHDKLSYKENFFTKKIEHFDFTVPEMPLNNNSAIQGIMAYDLTDSGATANITDGGIGCKFVKLRLKSDRGKPLNYDVYIFV